MEPNQKSGRTMSDLRPGRSAGAAPAPRPAARPTPAPARPAGAQPQAPTAAPAKPKRLRKFLKVFSLTLLILAIAAAIVYLGLAYYR